MLITSLYKKQEISYFILRTSDLHPLPLPSFHPASGGSDLLVKFETRSVLPATFHKTEKEIKK